ncbi:MAG: PilW family protein [Clostridia bacterium]|nr:PilW family protein [Deltaproteobacteria bacterium]
MRAVVRKSERGFTLLELMVSAALGLIVIGGVFGTMVTQQQTYMAQLQLSESSQNARAAIDIIRTSLRTAGWGFVSSETATGLPPIGTCWAANAVDQSTCSDQVAQNPDSSGIVSDKMRIVGMEPGGTFSRNTTWTSSTKATVNDVTRTQLVVGDLAIISGTCSAGATGVYNGIVKISAVSTSSGAVTYTLSTSVTGYPPFACTALSAGFAFGLARVVEFYIDRSLANTEVSSTTKVPRLMMFLNRGGRDPYSTASNSMTVEQAIAYDIDNLQVRYGLDCGTVPSGALCSANTSGSPDNILDNITNGNPYCNDLRTTNCNSGYSELQNQMRVMAVQIAIVPRTRDQIRRTSTGKKMTGAATTVFGSSIPADAYRRWVFRATIALRNNQLPKKS